MTMALERALLLSSRQQAETYERENEGVIVGNRKTYKLLVRRILSSDIYRFEIFRVTYPEAERGKGRGDPHIAEKAHFSMDKTLQEIIGHLQRFQFSVDTLWSPVEDGDVEQ